LGLDILGAQRTGGTEQRAIEQQGISADLAQFTEERDYPQRQLMFMQSLLQGLPLETQTYSSYEPTGLQSLAALGGEGMDVIQMLREYGLFPGGTTPAPTAQISAGALQAAINAMNPNFVGPDPKIG
jgi:hypothetical protein